MSLDLPVSPRPSALRLDELPWERFEAFAHDLIARLPGYSGCHRYGKQGQVQRGIDVFADNAGGQRWAFSNKRYKRYQVNHVSEHISETTYSADQYVILLSSVASTDVRDEVAKHPKWELWDSDDLSQKVRDLAVAAPDAARELVDHHFGTAWRRDFLGLPAVASFLTPTDFFRELLGTDRLLHHSFDLIGRAGILASLMELITKSNPRVAVLPGRGGIGKTRLLRALAVRIEEDVPEPAIRFLLDGPPLTVEALDELPTRPCLVVVDDAHRCDELSLLLAYARHRPNLKILLATRPNGLDRIHAELNRVGFDPSEVLDLPSLGPLSPSEMRDLARMALGTELRDRVDLVDRLALVTGDCPLATVIGGRLLADRAIPPEILEQDETFRRAVFDRFRDERLGHLGGQYPAGLARHLLEVLAAVNPIHEPHNHPIFKHLADEIRSDPIQVARLMGELEQVGLLTRRGGRLRLVPDVFADHLLASACLTPQNRPTGFAERVFQVFHDICPERVLRNLAELDWRVRSAGGEETQLLAGMWASIGEAFRTGTSGVRVRIIDSVMDAAYYQPRQVLELARMAIHSPAAAGNSTLDGARYSHEQLLEHLPELLRRCAYSPETLSECLDLLWRLGVTETRSPEEYSSHPFKRVQEIAKYDYSGQWWVGREVARRATHWLQSPEGLIHRKEIMDIVEPLLAKSGEEVWSEGHGIRCVSFLIPYEEVREARQTSFTILRACLDSGDAILQRQALGCLERALNGPMPVGNLALGADVFAAWEPDQLEILGILAAFIEQRHSTIVELRTYEALRFQAAYGPRSTVRERARTLIRQLEGSFEVRLFQLFLRRLSRWDDADDVETSDGTSLAERLANRHRERHEALVPEFSRLHPTASEAFAYLDQAMRMLRALEPDTDPGSFLWFLFASRPDEVSAFAELVLATPDSPLADLFSTCLVHVRRCDSPRATALARAAVDSGQLALTRSTANHYCWDWPDEISFAAADIGVLQRLLAHPDADIKERGLGALHHLARTEPGLARDMAMSVDVGDQSQVAEALARLTDPAQPDFLASLSEDDMCAAARKMDLVPRIGHWVCELLRRIATRTPDEIVDLFLRRVKEYEIHGYRSGYDLIPQRGLNRMFEPTVGSDQQPSLIRRVRDQSLTGGQWLWCVLPQLYRAVSGNFGIEGMLALREWLDTSDPNRVVAAARLVGKAGSQFLFDNYEFVNHLLGRAETLGQECFSRVRSSLLGMASSMSRHGPAGQPFPQDITQRERAQTVLARLPAGTAAHRLYEDIRQDAERRIREETARDAEDV